METTKYVLGAFLTLDQVAQQSGLTIGKLVSMQQAGCLPGPAYTFAGDGIFNSVFGVHAESFSLEFYPASHVAKAKEIAGLDDDFTAAARQLEAGFKKEYRAFLMKLDAKDYGLDHLFDEEGAVAGEAVETLLNAEWQHYLKGTYGLCTKNATVEEIATKEIMIAKIKFLDVELDMSRGNGAALLGELKVAVDALDQVSASFAPHERERSSRGKYIDAMYLKYGW